MDVGRNGGTCRACKIYNINPKNQTKNMENPKELTHWKKLTNPNYIGAYSLQPGEERIVEVVKVVREMVKGVDGKNEECTVAYLKNEKPFILNATNCKAMTKVFGTPYIETWQGRSVIIYAAKVRAFGEEVEALRVKNVKPPLPELSPASDKWQGAVKALASGSVSIEWIKERYILSKEFETQLINESNTPA